MTNLNKELFLLYMFARSALEKNGAFVKLFSSLVQIHVFFSMRYQPLSV